MSIKNIYVNTYVRMNVNIGNLKWRNHCYLYAWVISTYKVKNKKINFLLVINNLGIVDLYKL